jgi:hypothetical protein
MNSDLSDFFTSAGHIGITVVAVSIISLVYLGVIAFYIICQWKIFVKAGRPGWAAIIPFYNIYLEIEFVGLPWWLFLLLFIPGANIVVAILIAINLATVFGKNAGFAVGLIFLNFIFIPILAFDNSKYIPPASLATT